MKAQLLNIFILIALVSCKDQKDNSLSESNSIVHQNKMVQSDSPKDELIEIMRLTNLLYKVEKGVNKINSDYDIIQEQNNSESPLNSDEKLLSDINNFQTMLENNKAELNHLKKELNALKTNNKDVKKIKEDFLKMVEEKNEQIQKLVDKTVQLESEIKERDVIIEENKQTISQQNNTISSQNTKIEKLNQKHVIIYSRKATKNFVVEGNKISISEKLKNVELISEHQEGSYRINTVGKDYCELIITDGNTFWNESNYVIIRVRKL